MTTVTAKPRLKRASSGLWECSDSVVARAGKTPREAYDHWMVAALLETQQRTSALAKARKRPGRGQAITVAPPKPEKAAAPRRRRDEPLPYQGSVLVVPGTKAAARPLVLPPQMRLAAQRAAECQVRLAGLGGNDARPRAGARPPDESE